MKLPNTRTSLLITGGIMLVGALTGAALTANRGISEFAGWTLFYAAFQAPVWLMLALYARRTR